jgi:hypothetical protein
MYSTCCALGSVGEYHEHQLVVVTGVINRQYGRIDGEEKILLK